jgi:hypothetical protein
MSTAEGCTKQPRRCAVLAATATDPELKDTLTSMAQNWMKLALDVENDPPKPSKPAYQLAAAFYPLPS